MKERETTMDLTRDDYDVLMDALKAWENKDLAGNLMGSLLESMIPKGGDSGDGERMADAWDRRESQQREAKQQRLERSIMLQAKLLHMRDRLDANTFAESAFRR